MRIKRWIVTALLLTPGVGWGQDPMAPGTYLNPYVIRQTPNGVTIQGDLYTGGDPLAPGNVFNPYVIERRQRGEYELRPQLPYFGNQDSQEDSE
jgi:hypothetical protein